MKLISLLDPALPSPWGDIELGKEDTATALSIALTEDTFRTDLVLPVGSRGQAYTKAVETLALRKDQIVIHTNDLRMVSLHYVANEAMGDIPMLVKTTDYVLRLNPVNPISPAAVFCQLTALWKGLKVQSHLGARKGDIERLLADTEIAPMTDADEGVAQEAIAIMVRAHILTLKAASLRGEARECMATLAPLMGHTSRADLWREPWAQA